MLFLNYPFSLFVVVVVRCYCYLLLFLLPCFKKNLRSRDYVMERQDVNFEKYINKYLEEAVSSWLDSHNIMYTQFTNKNAGFI